MIFEIEKNEYWHFFEKKYTIMILVNAKTHPVKL